MIAICSFDISRHYARLTFWQSVWSVVILSEIQGQSSRSCFILLLLYWCTWSLLEICSSTADLELRRIWTRTTYRRSPSIPQLYFTCSLGAVSLQNDKSTYFITIPNHLHLPRSLLAYPTRYNYTWLAHHLTSYDLPYQCDLTRTWI